MYLTNELKFPKESISGMMMVSAPANILMSIISGYFSAKSPFKYLYYCSVVCVFVSSYSILVLIRTFPTDLTEQQSPFNLVHIGSVMLINELANSFWFTSVNAIVLVIADKRVAGMHITLLTSMTNYA